MYYKYGGDYQWMGFLNTGSFLRSHSPCLGISAFMNGVFQREDIHCLPHLDLPSESQPQNQNISSWRAYIFFKKKQKVVSSLFYYILNDKLNNFYGLNNNI